MDWIQAIVLGIVQGLSEFLPISSTAHLRIVPELLGWSDPGTEFSAVIQLGTLVAVLLFFRKDVVQLSWRHWKASGIGTCLKLQNQKWPGVLQPELFQ